MVSDSGTELWQKRSWQTVDTMSSHSHHMTSKSGSDKCVLSQGCRQMRINSFQLLPLPTMTSVRTWLGSLHSTLTAFETGLTIYSKAVHKCSILLLQHPSAGITPRELPIHNSLQIFFFITINFYYVSTIFPMCYVCIAYEFGSQNRVPDP